MSLLLAGLVISGNLLFVLAIALTVLLVLMREAGAVDGRREAVTPRGLVVDINRERV